MGKVYALLIAIVSWSQWILPGLNSPAAPASQPCTLVTGCVAAHSVRRRLVGSYAGNLFQLCRSDTTCQNIGQNGTDVDKVAINTFCGSNNANTCKYHIIYDQSGNGNDVTAVGGDVPFTNVGAWGSAPTPSVTFGTGLHYFNNASPTGLNVGNLDKSVVMVVNDSQFSDCCGTYGQAHSTATPSGVDACGDASGGDWCGTDFLLGLRASKGSGIGDSHCRRLMIDLELDVSEQCYAVDVPGGDSLLSAYQALSSFGDLVGIATYKASSKHVDLNWMDTYKSDLQYVIGMQNCDGTTPPHCDNQLRIGAGGDGSTVFAVWYEGLIYAKALNSGDQTTLIGNGDTYYSLSPTLCTETAGSESVLTTFGESALNAMWGLRRANIHIKGPLAVLNDGSTNHVIGAPANSCNFDTATAATDCPSGCNVVVLDNQVMSGRNWITATPTTSYSTSHVDGWRMDTASGGGPAYTGSCIGSLPCMTFTSTEGITTHSTFAWPQPYTIGAVGSNTVSGSFGGMLSAATNNHPYLGKGNAANSALFQADDSGGANNNGGATTGTNYFWGGEAESSTVVSVWVNGSRTGATATVTNSTTALELGKSNSYTGKIMEAWPIIGTAVTSGNMSTMYTKYQNYWGIP